MLKTEIFGTVVRPFARWRCGCGAANVSKLLPPLSKMEPVACRKCHRVGTLSIDVSPPKPATDSPVVDVGGQYEGRVLAPYASVPTIDNPTGEF